jgi:hypothetical protein
MRSDFKSDYRPIYSASGASVGYISHKITTNRFAAYKADGSLLGYFRDDRSAANAVSRCRST